MNNQFYTGLDDHVVNNARGKMKQPITFFPSYFEGVPYLYPQSSPIKERHFTGVLQGGYTHHTAG